MKRAKIELNSDQIINDYIKIAVNSLNMIALIFESTKEKEFNEIPAFSSPSLMEMKLQKFEYVQGINFMLNKWLIDKGIGDVIRGISFSLSRAKFFIRLTEEAQGKQMTIEEYENLEQQLSQEAIKKPFGKLIDEINKFKDESLSYIEEIKSINQLRNCIEHRNSMVQKIDFNDADEVLKLKWCEVVLTVDGEKITKLPINIKKGQKLMSRLEQSNRSFKLGETVVVNEEIFQGIYYTGYLFVNDLASKIFD